METNEKGKSSLSFESDSHFCASSASPSSSRSNFVPDVTRRRLFSSSVSLHKKHFVKVIDDSFERVNIVHYENDKRTKKIESEKRKATEEKVNAIAPCERDSGVRDDLFARFYVLSVYGRVFDYRKDENVRFFFFDLEPTQILERKKIIPNIREFCLVDAFGKTIAHEKINDTRRKSKRGTIQIPVDYFQEKKTDEKERERKKKESKSKKKKGNN